MARKKKKIPPRQEALVKTIRGIWSSLDSHLDYSIPGYHMSPCPHCGGRKHDADCVVEYAEMILDLARQL